MPEYFIRHRGNPDLVLAYSNGAIVLRWRNSADRDQLWGTILIDDKQHTYQIFNMGQSKGLHCAGYGNHLQLAPELGDIWQIAGNGDFGTFNGIRLFNNQDWNLNVLGNGVFPGIGPPPYGAYDTGAPVGVWNWSHGAPNELWTLAEVSTLPDPTSPNYYSLVPGYGGDFQLAVHDGDEGGTQAPTIAANISGQRVQFSVFHWPQGLAFQNRYNKKFIRWGGANQPLQWSALMSVDCQWTVDRPGDSPYKAIRPVREPRQNFNIFNAPYTPTNGVVGTWGWSGGKLNEIWAQDKIENPNG